LIGCYAIFVVTSLVYHSFARQWQIDSRVDPNRIAELRAAADTETDLDSAQQYARDSILILETRASDHLLAGLVSLAQYADLLLRCVSLAFHDLGPFWIPRLTLSMAQFS
jgi:cytidylate kinase